MPCRRSSSPARGSRLCHSRRETHPNLVRDRGEAYRDGLVARVRELGIDDHVVFFNQFVEQSTLLDFVWNVQRLLRTPYLNEAQMTSGHACLQFRTGQSGCIDALLAREGAAERRARDSGSVWRCQSHEQRDRRSTDQRCQAPCHAQTRLRGQPIDDVGANGQAPSRELRESTRARPACDRASG